MSSWDSGSIKLEDFCFPRWGQQRAVGAMSLGSELKLQDLDG